MPPGYETKKRKHSMQSPKRDRKTRNVRPPADPSFPHYPRVPPTAFGQPQQQQQQPSVFGQPAQQQPAANAFGGGSGAPNYPTSAPLLVRPKFKDADLVLNPLPPSLCPSRLFSRRRYRLDHHRGLVENYILNNQPTTIMLLSRISGSSGPVSSLNPRRPIPNNNTTNNNSKSLQQPIRTSTKAGGAFGQAPAASSAPAFGAPPPTGAFGQPQGQPQQQQQAANPFGGGIGGAAAGQPSTGAFGSSAGAFGCECPLLSRGSGQVG